MSERSCVQMKTSQDAKEFEALVKKHNLVITNKLELKGRVIYTMAINEEEMEEYLLDTRLNWDFEVPKAVNYSVKGLIHFKDGVLNNRPGKTKVKATDSDNAKDVYKKMILDIWDKPNGTVKQIEILEVSRG